MFSILPVEDQLQYQFTEQFAKKELMAQAASFHADAKMKENAVTLESVLTGDAKRATGIMLLTAATDVQFLVHKDNLVSTAKAGATVKMVSIVIK